MFFYVDILRMINISTASGAHQPISHRYVNIMKNKADTLLSSSAVYDQGLRSHLSGV